MKILNFLMTIVKKLYIMSIYFFFNNFILTDRFRAKIAGVLHPNIKVSRNVKLRRNVTLYAGGNINGKLDVGEGSFINEEVFLDFSGELIIGKDVGLAMRSMILSSTHKIGDLKRAGPPRKKKTVIGDNAWIGASAIIYPGVSVGSGSVVAAGEIVTVDIPPNKLYKGAQLQDIILKKRIV